VAVAVDSMELLGIVVDLVVAQVETLVVVDLELEDKEILGLVEIFVDLVVAVLVAEVEFQGVVEEPHGVMV
jgi:hypothetical protein